MVQVSQKTEMEVDKEARRQEEYNQVAFPKKIESFPPHVSTKENS